MMIRILCGVLALCLFSGQALADATLQRIQKNQEINCGVYVLGSIFSYDTKGNPQGFTTDLMSEVSSRTGLKVKYTEISSFATLFEDMKTGHFDMICAPLLLLPASLMKAMPGALISVDPINIYADATADFSAIKTLDQLNDARYTFVGMDGELGGMYAPKLFPKAKLNLLPTGSAAGGMFMEVHTRKADFVVLSSLAAKAYDQANPGKLKQVTDQPLISSSVRMFFPEDSETLRANMDVLIEEMRRDGTLDRLLEKHGLINKPAK